MRRYEAPNLHHLAQEMKMFLEDAGVFLVSWEYTKMKTFVQTSSLQVNENLPKKIIGKCEVKYFLGINKRLITTQNIIKDTSPKGWIKLYNNF